MRKTLLAAGAALLLAAGPAMAQQKPIKIGFVSTFSGPVAVIGNDMRNSLRARARPYGPQDGRPAGRGDLRGRRLQAGGRQAEDREADRIRPGRFHRRLHLVERAAGLDQAGRQFEDLPGHRQCRPLAGRRRTVLALCVLDLVAERPDAGGDGPLHEPEGREVGLPDRPELCRRQGHAGRRRPHLQGQGRSGRNSPPGRRSSTSPPSSPRPRPPIRTPSSCSIRARRACSSSANTRRPASRARSRSTPPSPSTKCRCPCRRTSRSACPARRNG